MADKQVTEAASVQTYGSGDGEHWHPVSVQTKPTAPESEPADSPKGKLWRRWFERVSEHATIDVIHATTELVLGEREIDDVVRADSVSQLVDALKKISECDEGCACLCIVDEDCCTIVGGGFCSRCFTRAALAAYKDSQEKKCS